MPQIHVGQAPGSGIIGAIEQDDMNEGHAQQQRHNGEEHDGILAKDLFGTYVAAAGAEEDDGQREAGAPPAYQQRGLHVVRGLQGGGLVA